MAAKNKKDQQQTWRNRIVGAGTIPASEFLANPRNWRIHSKLQQQALEGALSEIGWIQDVIVNQRTGNLIDGHLRVTLALRQGEDTPVPVKYVDLDEREEMLAIATLDPIAAMAKADKEKLDELLREVQTSDEAITQMLEDLAFSNSLRYGEDDKYTHTVEAPLYTPKGNKPKISELFDETRTNQLLDEIEQSDIPEDEKYFLRLAARRHTVFNYKMIAEYYAHASEEMQRLMENSALVIIDYNRAIELGYVKLTKRIAELYGEDHGSS